MDSVAGATPYGGPIFFDGRERSEGGLSFSTSAPADTALHTLGAVDRSNIFSAVLHSNLCTGLKLESLETRQRLGEMESCRRQEEILRALQETKQEVASIKTDAYARELAAAQQKLLVLELAKK